MKKSLETFKMTESRVSQINMPESAKKLATYDFNQSRFTIMITLISPTCVYYRVLTGIFE